MPHCIWLSVLITKGIQLRNWPNGEISDNIFSHASYFLHLEAEFLNNHEVEYWGNIVDLRLQLFEVINDLIGGHSQPPRLVEHIIAKDLNSKA